MSERNEKILLYVVLPLIVLVGGWFVFVSVKADEYNVARNARDTARESAQQYRRPYALSADERTALQRVFPRAADADGVRQWIEQVAGEHGGSLSEFAAGPSGSWDVRVSVPKEQAAALVSDLLDGVTRHELLPLAVPADDNARLVRVQRLSAVRSQGNASSLELRIVTPHPS
jgi:hypothetical protein